MTSKVLLIMNLLFLMLKRPVFVDLEAAFGREVQALLIPFIAIQIKNGLEFIIIR